MSIYEPTDDGRIAVLRERLLIAPRDAGLMCELAGLLETGGDIPGAIDLCQRALRVEPYDTRTMLRLAGLWAALGDAERAGSWLRWVLSLDADCGEAVEALQRLGETEILTQSYVRTLFDQYADRFDTELVETLRYQAPRLVAEALSRIGAGEGSADMLDLGCGTGLSGVALRPFARRLDGIDLSPRMVERARARGIYAELAVADAEAYLRAGDRRWDVIAAVDMLNYVGDLTTLLALATKRLSPGGLLAGTVEKAEAGGVALTEKKRYVHGEDHLRAAIQTAGLTLCALTEGMLRTEARVGVPGLVFVARLPSDTCAS